MFKKDKANLKVKVRFFASKSLPVLPFLVELVFFELDENFAC